MVGGLLAGGAGEEFGGVGGGEEGVETLAGVGGADAAVRGGPDQEEEGTLEVDAAGEVFLVFLFGSVGEEDGGVLGGAGKVGWVGGERHAWRHGDGGIEGGVGRMKVVGGDDEVDLFAGGGGGVEAFGGGAFDLEPSLDGRTAIGS